MRITLDDEARRILGLFESVTGATGVDCIGTSPDSDGDGKVIVVPPEDMAKAIGPDGSTVKAFEQRLGEPVRLVEAADRPTDFVANALAPAAVYDVRIDEDGSTTAVVDVAPEDRGVAIGEDGRRIETAKRLVARHFDVEDIRLVSD